MRAGLRRRRSSRSGGEDEIAVYTTGIGASSARAAAETVIARGVPRRVLITGLCGSLDAQFRPGDALLYASVQGSDGVAHSTDRDLTAVLQRALPHATSRIRAVSSDRIVTRATEKRALAKESGCQAVDMESLALLGIFQRAGTSVAILRVVSDGIDHDLPDFAGAVDGAGNLDGKAIARAFLLNPVAAFRMARHAITALPVLGRCIHFATYQEPTRLRYV